MRRLTRHNTHNEPQISVPPRLGQPVVDRVVISIAVVQLEPYLGETPHLLNEA